ncbi:MAG TPA: sigma-70 family RNA polymerase sigma factor [Ktedonobacteraceae bacterium]|nr:sigma-70 family RNA polymerase sigma factor [Ktedonobacteraceae bacterium]
MSITSGKSSQLPESPGSQPAGGKSQEFQAFYQENLGPIYRYVYSKVGNKQEAEDLTSQIFVKAIRGIDGLRGLKSMQKWLFQVARTTIADYWRVYYRASIGSLDEMLEAGWEGPTEQEPLEELHSAPERVQSILQMLPDQYREVLICRFLQNLSIKETAFRLGLSEANVKVVQFRALKRAASIQ